MLLPNTTAIPCLKTSSDVFFSMPQDINTLFLNLTYFGNKKGENEQRGVMR